MLNVYFIVSLILHIAIVSICLLNCVQFYKTSLSSETTTKKVFLSLSLFFLAFSLTYILRIIMVFALPSDLTQFYNEIVYERSEKTQFIAIAYAFGVYIALMILSTIVERALFKMKTKFIFSFLILGSCLLIGLLLIISVFTFYDATYIQLIPLIVSLFVVAIFSIAYLRIGIKYTGQVRKKSLFIAFGLISFVIGLMLSSKGIIQFSFQTQILLSPILILVSMILLQFGYSKER